MNKQKHMLNIFSVSSATLIYQQTPPHTQNSNKTHSKGRKWKPSSVEWWREVKNRTFDSFFFPFFPISFMKDTFHWIPRRVALDGHSQAATMLEAARDFWNKPNSLPPPPWTAISMSIKLGCWETDIRRPNKANPSPHFTSGNGISWGFDVPQGGSYPSNSALWRADCHCYTWSAWARSKL